MGALKFGLDEGLSFAVDVRNGGALPMHHSLDGAEGMLGSVMPSQRAKVTSSAASFISAEPWAPPTRRRLQLSSTESLRSHDLDRHHDILGALETVIRPARCRSRAASASFLDIHRDHHESSEPSVALASQVLGQPHPSSSSRCSASAAVAVSSDVAPELRSSQRHRTRLGAHSSFTGCGAGSPPDRPCFCNELMGKRKERVLPPMTYYYPGEDPDAGIRRSKAYYITDGSSIEPDEANGTAEGEGQEGADRPQGSSPGLPANEISIKDKEDFANHLSRERLRRMRKYLAAGFIMAVASMAVWIGLLVQAQRKKSNAVSRPRDGAETRP